MIKFGIDNKKLINKYKCNYCHHFPILSLLGINNHLPLLHISKRFVYLHHIEERINEFAISFMLNPTLHVNKSFKEQIEKFMNDTFGTLTQPFIINTVKKKNTCVLSLVMFYETRH